MSPESAEAEFITRAAQSLMDEGFRMFVDAHEMWEGSLHARTADERLRVFGKAIEQERLAIEKQRVAIDLQRRAFELHSEEFLRKLMVLKLAPGG